MNLNLGSEVECLPWAHGFELGTQLVVLFGQIVEASGMWQGWKK